MGAGRGCCKESPLEKSGPHWSGFLVGGAARIFPSGACPWEPCLVRIPLGSAAHTSWDWCGGWVQLHFRGPFLIFAALINFTYLCRVTPSGGVQTSASSV